MKVLYCFGIVLVTLGGCGPSHQPQEPVTNSRGPVVPAPSAPPAVTNTAPATPAPAPSKSVQPPENTSLPEPDGPIDPTSVEAAGQVVQHYGALIEQGRWRESWKLWSDPSSGKQFDRNWLNDSEVHVEIGNLGRPEGAAGSIYVTMPVAFYGKDKNDKAFRRPADVILRRVNDVPGSTEAQRRWHIERIDWKDAG